MQDNTCFFCAQNQKQFISNNNQNQQELLILCRMIIKVKTLLAGEFIYASNIFIAIHSGDGRIFNAWCTDWNIAGYTTKAAT